MCDVHFFQSTFTHRRVAENSIERKLKVSVVCCPLSVVCCPLSVVGCQLSVVGCPLSVVGCPLSRTEKVVNSIRDERISTNLCLQ